MASVKQLMKSKSVNFNVFMPMIMVALPMLGVPVTPGLTAGILALGNILLRFVTKESIADK